METLEMLSKVNGENLPWRDPMFTNCICVLTKADNPLKTMDILDELRLHGTQKMLRWYLNVFENIVTQDLNKSLRLHTFQRQHFSSIHTSKRRPLRYSGDLMRTYRILGDRAKLASYLTTRLATKLATILLSLATMLGATESGATRKITRRDDRRIVRQALVDPTVTRSMIRADVGVAIVPQTISRHLAEANLKSKCPSPAFPLTPEHRQLRLQWCQARSMWNVTDWQKVVFIDEYRFVLGSKDNRVRVWRRPGERYNPSPLPEQLV
ncbi:transposable element Tcb2 transposase [Trichonephila clavipes]|nr:transposable element Tcb2 transposase [Trichonephila clavipes]